MNRLLPVLLSAVLSTSAAAQSLDARDLNGRKVEVAEQGTLVVFWSLDDADARADLKALQALADGGQHVVAVNTDGAQRRSELKPFVRRHGWSVTVVSDTSGVVAKTLEAKPGDTVLLAPSSTLTAAWKGASPEDLYRAPETSVAFAWVTRKP